MDIVVSWSEISAFRACPMKHWLDYRQRQPRTGSAPAADLGTVWHLLQQDWYAGRIHGRLPADLATAIPAAHLTYEPRSEAELDQLSTLLWMWDGFLEAGDPFAHCVPLAVEQEWVVPLPRVPGQPDDVRFCLKVVIDLLVQQGRRLYVVDHKSQARWQAPDTLSRDMEMEDQLGLYLYATRYTRGNRGPTMSACWNYAVTTDTKTKPREPADRFWQAWSARTDAALDRTAQEAAETAMAAYARPLAVEPPRHPDKETCRWRCSYRAPCYYARDANRSVELDEPTRADQAPDGINRTEYR